MKRMLVLAAAGAAAALLPAPAHADHLCVESSGRPVWCAPHIALETERICVTQHGNDLVCVF